MKKRFSLFRVKESDHNQPVTKQDFNNLQSNLIWPPAFTRDYDMLKAQEYRQEKDDVLLSNTLPVEEKLRILAEIDKDYLLFKKKAEDKLSQSIPVWGTQRVHADNASSTPLRIDKISESFPKNQKSKVHSILKGLVKSGELTWTDRGEIYYPDTNTLIPGSDIQTLVKYNLQTNKTISKQPHGYEIFEEALHRSHKPGPAHVPAASVRHKTPVSKRKRKILRTESIGEEEEEADEAGREAGDEEGEFSIEPPYRKVSKRTRSKGKRKSRTHQIEENDKRVEKGIRRVIDTLLP